jgi:hypothetical protein
LLHHVTDCLGQAAPVANVLGQLGDARFPFATEVVDRVLGGVALVVESTAIDGAPCWLL